MVKEDQIIEMIADMAVQSTRQNLELKEELLGEINRLGGRVGGVEGRMDKLEDKVDRVETSLRAEMRDLRNDNAHFHDEIIGYLKRAEQEHVFTSEHLRRHDLQFIELQQRVGIK